MIPLLDVSRHQGAINWPIVKSWGFQGVIIRAGNGMTKDSRVDINMDGARSVGLLRGCYWFANPKAALSGAAQGRALAAAHHLYGCELPPMWDAESYSNEAGPNPVLAGAPQARWLTEMAWWTDGDSGRRSLGYTGASYWNTNVAPGKFDIANGRFTPEWRADMEYLHDRDFILARYPGQHRSPPIIGPIVDNLPRGVPPDQWTNVAIGTGKEPPNLTGRTRNWDAWQWSAGGNAQGAVYGASSTDLDLNIVRPDVWHRWTNVGPEPPPGGDDMQTVTFEVTGLPGIYMWTPGSDPIPFTDIPNFQNLSVGLQANALAAPLSKDMYDRLFTKPVTVNVPPIAVPPVVIPPFPTHFTGTIT